MKHSPPLIKLRVLTGAHAGAELKLAPGSYSIGPHIESDIVISDWPGSISTLDLRPDGASIDRMPEEGGAEPPIEMSPLIPVALGVLVLVVALASAEWPSDVELLRTFFDRPAQSSLPVAAAEPASALAETDSGRWRWWGLLIGGSAVMGLSFAVAAAVASRQPAPSPQEIDAPTRGRSIRSLLDRAWAPEVSMVAEKDHVSLRGWVRDRAQAELLKKTFARDAQVKHAYAVVQNLQAVIADRLGEADAQVLYEGHGAFRITGSLRQPERAQRAAGELRAELGASVSGISFDAPSEKTELAPDGKARSIVYLADGQVMTTADGKRKSFKQRSE